MNNQNLIPFDRRTEIEQREIRSKGGKASGVKRREIKKISDIIKRVREELENFDPVEAGIAQAMIDLINPLTKPQDRIKIAEFIRDTIGEKPTNKTELTGEDGAEIKVTIKDLSQN